MPETCPQGVAEFNKSPFVQCSTLKSRVEPIVKDLGAQDMTSDLPRMFVTFFLEVLVAKLQVI